MNKEELTARLIKNTRRIKRLNNLIEIAGYIGYLSDEIGGLSAVAKIIGISIEMLRKFLNVQKIKSTKVLKLIEERKIDSVAVVDLLKVFKSFEQERLAEEIITGRMTSGDLKALVPYKRKFPHLNIETLVKRIQKSKNVKVYLLYFKVPKEIKDISIFRRKLETIVGRKEINSLEANNGVGLLKLTKLGQREISRAAKIRHQSLRIFIANMLRQG
jgi:hypothetical protein